LIAGRQTRRYDQASLMSLSRAILSGVWFGLTLAAFGCAQLAGLTEDYHLADAGMSAGGSVGAAGRGGSGGRSNESDDAGAAGELSANSDAGATASGGGATGSGGSTINTGGSSETGGSDNSAGSNSLGGAGGGGASGPTHIGSSQFHDSAFGNDNASSHLANATFSKPAGTMAGDLMLVFFGADHSLANMDGTTLDPLGWTLIDQHTDYGTDGQAGYLLYKFASSNEPDQIVFYDINSAGSGNGVQGLLSVYRGVSTDEPVNNYDKIVIKMGADGSHFVNATPALITSVPNCLLIAGLSPDTTIDRPLIDSWPSGFTENQVSVLNGPNPYPLAWANIFAAEGHQTSPGTVPASAFAWTVSNDTDAKYYGYYTFVLALAPAN
jgi:hypothetical protein